VHHRCITAEARTVCIGLEDAMAGAREAAWLSQSTFPPSPSAWSPLRRLLT